MTLEQVHKSKTKFLDAAVAVIRSKGYEAMRVDDVCAEAGLTKGSFFHHFKSKEELALAAADHFASRADGVFARAPFRQEPGALDRLLGYIDFRKAAMSGDLAGFTCLLGMIAQEAYQTNPELSSVCGAHIDAHASTLMPDIEAARAASVPNAPWSPQSLALFTQAVVQGAFVLGKSQHDPAVAAACMDHLRNYLLLLLKAPQPAAVATRPAKKPASKTVKTPAARRG
jgi:TetR/AcrR family transcriptional repressor of nem operon